MRLVRIRQYFLRSSLLFCGVENWRLTANLRLRQYVVVLTKRNKIFPQFPIGISFDAFGTPKRLY